jgi:anti-sigma regulatory factor (Ser/Thr protein kinase)
MLYSESLSKTSTASAKARRMLDRVAMGLDPETVENARLVVSELVANAVEHVAEDGSIEVRMDCDGASLRVEVLDPGPGFTPRPRAKDTPRDSGWGLHFTDLLSDRWGADRDVRARVWFEMKGR